MLLNIVARCVIDNQELRALFLAILNEILQRHDIKITRGELLCVACAGG